MYANSSSAAVLCLLVLVAISGCLPRLCHCRPADIVARVPSNFYAGTKWVLFRDDNIPDPPANVILAENEVQVLPTSRRRYQPVQEQYQQQPQLLQQGPYFYDRPSGSTTALTPAQHQQQQQSLEEPLVQLIGHRYVQPSYYEGYFAQQQQQQPQALQQGPYFYDRPGGSATTLTPMQHQQQQQSLDEPLVQLIGHRYVEPSYYEGYFAQQQQQHELEHNSLLEQQQREQEQPQTSHAAAFGVTLVPEAAVHVSGPSYQYFRKRKSVR